MVKLKNMSNGRNCQGVTIILLWFIAISVMHTIEKGDHLHLGLCIGPLEASMGLHVWRKLLP